ncbi:hypothetical protein jhhlp_007772 [Lomentospora prolificans]|uniref:Uncharacterized protein n=1 Tax=Lomentospora prolificans TaxID=41688 RepID=A0A2N3N0I3_9PEZI|nr:hypothetical protein jhhlp_007772 [Lomentospora prolificans]
MRFAAIFSTVAALAATATARPSVAARDDASAIANIIAINGFGPGAPPGVPVQVPFGTLTHVDLSITTLQLTGVTVNVPDAEAPADTDITCQMYKDQYGVQPGSAEFSKGKDAHISTNPVPFGWVLCYVNVHSE